MKKMSNTSSTYDPVHTFLFMVCTTAAPDGKKGGVQNMVNHPLPEDDGM